MMIFDKKLNKEVVVVDARTNSWQPVLWEADREIEMVECGEYILADEVVYLNKYLNRPSSSV